jgi:hypothetical protein
MEGCRLRDGHHVVNLQSTTGETIETDHLKQVCARCAATPVSGRRIQGPVRSIAGNTLFRSSSPGCATTPVCRLASAADACRDRPD